MIDQDLDLEALISAKEDCSHWEKESSGNLIEALKQSKSWFRFDVFIQSFKLFFERSCLELFEITLQKHQNEEWEHTWNKSIEYHKHIISVVPFRNPHHTIQVQERVKSHLEVRFVDQPQRKTEEYSLSQKQVQFSHPLKQIMQEYLPLRPPRKCSDDKN